VEDNEAETSDGAPETLRDISGGVPKVVEMETVAEAVSPLMIVSDGGDIETEKSYVMESVTSADSVSFGPAAVTVRL
jgi:hypothetical protein